MTQHTPKEIKAIADGLTASQRDVIHASWPYPDFHRKGEQISYCPIWRGERNRAALERKGLIASLALGGPRLKPLGLAVRQHLHDSD